jgi:predicted GNAT family acetyltransferase
MIHPLDNPVWHALSTSHSSFAQGDDLAKRYPMSVCPLAGLASPSPQAYRRLAELVQPEGAAGLVLTEPPSLPSGLTVVREMRIAQMIADGTPAATKEHQFTELSQTDVTQMLALCELTKPGPFKPRTYELGTYLGIKAGGALVAMAGERLRLTGFTEVSAVCTHPDCRGRGYAQALVGELARRIRARQEIPFLHVKTDNVDAIHVYEKLGFRIRRHVYVAVMRTLASAFA